MSAYLRPALVLRLAVLAACGLPLGGCFAIAPIAAATSGFYTSSATGKLPWDQFVSWSTGEDCSAVHVENH